MDKTVTNALTKAVISLHKEFQQSRTNRLRQREKPEERVWQGRGNPLSSVFEFETAKNLSKIYTKYHFFVDYPITIYNKSGEKLRTIYPDILVLKNFNLKKNDKCEVVAILDLKIDLGWANMKDYKEENDTKLSDKEKDIEEASLCKFNYIVGAYSDTEKELNDNIGKLEAKMPGTGKLKKIFIICTKGNDHSRSERVERALKSKGYKVLFLLDDKNLHPNTIEEKSGDFKRHIQRKEAVIKRVFRGL